MRKYLIIILLSTFAIASKAQTVSYTPYIPGANSTNSYQAPQTQSEIVRTTAYYSDYSGNLYKVPIKVSITSNGYSTIIKVIEKYNSAIYSGKWEKVYSSGNASKCVRGIGGGYLEEQFMYKALVDAKYWYFDL